MADGIGIRLENGVKLDRMLAKMSIDKRSAATKIVWQSLKNASAEVRKSVKAEAPKSDDGVSGNNLASRNHPKGTLKRSVKSGLKKRVNLGQNTFLSSVYVQDGHKNSAPNNADGWYAHFVQTGKGFSGMSNWKSYRSKKFMEKGALKAKNKARKILGDRLAEKIAAFSQSQINKL